MATIVLAFSCTKPEVQESFTMNSDTSVQAGAAAQAVTFNFVTNCAWNISIPSATDWVTLSRSEAEASSESVSYSVSASLKANTGGARSTKLYLNYGTKGLSMELTVNQSGAGGMKPCTVSSITDDILFSTVPAATSTAVTQGFDFSEDQKYMFFSQLNSNYKNILSRTLRVPVTTSTTLASDRMTLLYFSHGNNIHYEKGTDGSTYIWLANFSTVQSDGKYNQPQVLSRVKFVPGTTLRSVDATDNYYFGTHNLHASFDEKNDQLAILSQPDGYVVKVYKLSQVLALPVTEVTLDSPITYGGEGVDAKTTVTPKIKARDCRTLTPLYTFTYRYPSYGRSWQTYCIYDNKAYFFLYYTSAVTAMAYRSVIDVVDFKGNVLRSDITQPFADNVSDLEKYGLTDSATKYMENEGIIVRDGVLYLLYAGKNAAGFRRPCVFNFDAKCLE